jgi:dynein heavy chain
LLLLPPPPTPAQIFYGGHITDGMDRRCCITYLSELIRPQILPGGSLDDPASWSQPALELAPGFQAPLPTSFEGLQEHIESALPAESPVMYGMHPNAGVLLSTSLCETLFKTLTDVSGGGTGRSEQTRVWTGSQPHSSEPGTSRPVRRQT